MKNIVVTILILVIMDGTIGCVRVKPWQRDMLSKRSMMFQSEKDENILDHTFYEAREGADGGFQSGGGGCGCK